MASADIAFSDVRPVREGEILAVDLDGTLLRSDLLYETFWSAFSQQWHAPFSALNYIAEGKAALKARLAEMSAIDVAHLPYNPEVISLIRRWRANGGKVILVTASVSHLARRIADHLELFDEVHGTENGINLKGAAKAQYLENLYGRRGYSYVGDCRADLPVWESARTAVAVDAGCLLRSQLSYAKAQVEFIRSPRPRSNPYIATLRPHQWTKNILIFVPLVAAQQFDILTLIASVIAFLSFSLVASSVYIFNDLLDLSADRMHPRKRRRVLASGALPIAHGTFLFPALLVAGVLLAALLPMRFLMVLAFYYASTLAYSIYLKRKLLIDICVLAGLYTIRILAGAAATGIHLSVWLLAFSVFFFLSLAAVKRQAELRSSLSLNDTKTHGRGYRTDDLDIVSQMAISSGYISVLVLALYINSGTVRALYSMPEALWGICLVLLFWVSRMVMVTHRGRMHDDPLVFAVRDRVSRICLCIMLVFAAASVIL